MTRLLAAATAIAALALTTSVQAKDPAPRKRELEKYTGLYFAVKDKHGARTPGRNVRRHGVRILDNRHRRATRPATAAEVGRSIRTFRRWLAPPMPIARAADNAPPPTAPTRAGGRWAIPAHIVMCESRGSYTAHNPQSGAYGAYQVLPSTARAFGCNLSTPAGQDRCAAKIWAVQGPSAWVCAG